jgi:hypothetical protein
MPPGRFISVTISNLHRFALFRDLRCIWTTPFWKMISRSFFALRIDPVVCPLCGVSYGIRGASDAETAAVCADAVVRNSHYRRMVRCEARRLRVVRDREYRNTDLEPRGGTRRNNLER